jgi:hypothetical protein
VSSEQAATRSSGQVVRVGPVLDTSREGRAVLAAICRSNAQVEVIERGAYSRVLVPGCCVVTRRAIEDALGSAFVFPADLEAVMPAFKGFLRLDPERVEWRCERV